MPPRFQALQEKMLQDAITASPRRKKCPKCGKVKDVETKFGFRTQHHPENGKPLRTMAQSYCADCRKLTS